jgi:PAS domain S-box-containing protein
MTLLLPMAGWAHVPEVDLLADVASALVLLGGGVLVFRSFRQRHLLCWIFGWASYVIYRGSSDGLNGVRGPSLTAAISQIAFIVAITLFAAAVLQYARRFRLMIPLVIVAGIIVELIILQQSFWPSSYRLLLAIQILYRVITFTAAIQLVKYSLGRREIGPWLMALMLCLIHMDTPITQGHPLESADVVIDTLLGLSLLIVVLEESKMKAGRLEVLNRITDAIAKSQECSPMIMAVMLELKDLLGAKAVWFRLLEGDVLRLQQCVGVSEDFARAHRDSDTRFGHGAALVKAGSAILLDRASSLPMVREALVQDGMDHILLIPVRGKAAVIGTLSLGMGRARVYQPEEVRFLNAAAKQLGIATENLQLIQRISASQKRWANTFDAMPELSLVHDREFRIQQVNRALLARLGWEHEPEKLVGQLAGEVLRKPGATWKNCPYCESQKAEVEAPDPVIDSYSIVSTSSYSEEGGGGSSTIHIIRDMTERRAAEERYRTLFEQVREGVFVSSPQGRILECNDAFVRILGYESREELLERARAQDFYLNPMDRHMFLEEMEENGFVKNFEFEMKRRDGSVVTVLENSYGRRDKTGAIERFNGVLLDISEKKKIEDEIRRRNRELEALNTIAVLANQSFDMDEITNMAMRQIVDLFRADTAAVYLFDKEAKLLKRVANYGQRGTMLDARQFSLADSFVEFLEKEKLEVVTQDQMALFPAEATERMLAEGLKAWIWSLMWTNEKLIGIIGISSRTEGHFSELDQKLMITIGRQLANSLDKVRLYDETMRAYEDLRKTQEQLLQSEKMSAVGQLISGVAHELNNPLTAILGYAQLLESDQLSDRARDYVGKLFKQAQRTHRVVQNLLSFARQRKAAKMPCDLRRVVEDTLALRDYDMSLHNISVEKEFPENLPPVVADPHQVEQVFLNVINNAVDAMLENAKSGLLHVRIWTDGGYVSVEFHDTGPGIRELNRIFDPFYTTKSLGKGTGLGLSICYGIVKEHGGDIRAHNHLQGGAVIRVLLPISAVEEGVSHREAGGQRVIPLQGRVLIVDDEEAVLEFERDVLSGAGAEVSTATRGEDAIYQLQRGKFDAILVDSWIPGGCSGVEIYRWVATNQPGLEKRIVLTLSNITDSEVRSFVEENGVATITKPFEVSDLIAIARSAMQKTSSAVAVP